MKNRNEQSAIRDFSALTDFGNLINSSLELNFSLNNLVLTCFGKFHSTKALVFIKEERQYRLSFKKGAVECKTEIFNEEEFDNYLSELKNNFEIVEPINGRRGKLGLFCLGAKFGGNEFNSDDIKFVQLILNVAATAIENSLTYEKLRKSNRELDYKVNQLASLFDLSKEFSGILDVDRVTKLLTFSLIGQLMVAEYAIVLYKNMETSILASKFPTDELRKFINDLQIERITEPLDMGAESSIKAPEKLSVELVIPMVIKETTRGLIILGERKNRLPYSKSDIEFAQSLAGIAIISIENAELIQEVIEKQKMEKELETAREIQKSLLPQVIPESEVFQIAAYSESAKRVGGDYYDIIKLNNYRTLIAVADVSGKGVQASLLMANLQAFLKSISKLNYELDEASNFLNDLVSENTRMGNFITFFWGLLDERDGSLTYVNAGHNPPLLLQNKKMIKLRKGGMILGFMKTMVPYVSEKIYLNPGDSLVIFTDGITEAMDANYNEYSDERLEKLVLEISDYKSAEDILDKIKSDVLAHTKGCVQSDDITCMVVKVK